MQAEEEQLEKRSKRYFQLTVASLFLMALLRGLNAFFFTLFFWPAVGFGVLAFYYQRAAKRELQAKTAQWHHPDSAASSGFNNKRLTLIIIGGAVSLFVIISSLLASKKSRETSSYKETTQTDQPDLHEEKKSPDYDRALLEYNNKNYMQSISIARKALLGDPNNNDLMLVLGDNYGSLKQNDSSLVWFDRAYQNGARSASLSHWLGYLYDDKGSVSQGIQFYKDALKQDSTRIQIYDRLAELEPEKADWYKKKSSQWAQEK